MHVCVQCSSNRSVLFVFSLLLGFCLIFVCFYCESSISLTISFHGTKERTDSSSYVVLVYYRSLVQITNVSRTVVGIWFVFNNAKCFFFLYGAHIWCRCTPYKLPFFFLSIQDPDKYAVVTNLANNAFPQPDRQHYRNILRFCP